MSIVPVIAMMCMMILCGRTGTSSEGLIFLLYGSEGADGNNVAIATIENSGEPTTLRTEFLENPLGINTKKPRFSWIVEDITPGAKQTAYQVQAASSPEKLLKGEADLWESGKVGSSQSHLVVYEGKKLASRQQVWWRVKNWDQDGKASAWSEPARFELSLLEPHDWQAQWICAPEFDPVISEATRKWIRYAMVPLNTNERLAALTDEQRARMHERMLHELQTLRPAPLFRKTFDVGTRLEDARLYVAGLGCHEVTLNGERIDDTMFSPAESHFPEYTHYQVLDVTQLLRVGKNTLDILLGNGLYDEDLVFPPAYGKSLPLIAQLEMRTVDGVQIVVTDESWQCTPSPLLKNHFWLSECYDATLTITDWKPVRVIDSPTKKLVAQTLPPERILRRVTPVTVTQPKPGIWVFDMGELIVGNVELNLDVPDGTMLSVRYGEQVFRTSEQYDPRIHGSLLHYDEFNLTAPYPGLVACKLRGNGVLRHIEIDGIRDSYHALVPVDVYVARGGGERWHPRFAYHPFRYVEVSGLPGTPKPETVTGLVIHTDLGRRGSFDSSDEMLNRLHEAAVNSADYCTHANVNDNTGTEKQNGLTPAIASGKGAVFFRNEQPLWAKILRDMRAITPESMAPKMLGSGTRHPENWVSPSTIWSRHGVEMPWYYRLHYGDTETMAEYFPFMTAYVDWYTRAFEKDGTLPGDRFGDHMAYHTAYGQPYPVTTLDGSPNDGIPQVRHLTPAELCGAAYVIGMTRLTAQAADILGRDRDAVRFTGLVARMTEKFNEVYFRPDLNAYGYPVPQPVYSIQGGNALALFFDLVPEERRAAVLEALVADVRSWGGIATGMAATVPLLDVLTTHGHAELALKILTQEEYPGPGHSLGFGTKTLPEIWARPAEPAYASHVQSEYVWMARWFYTRLGGIQPDPVVPGFRHFFLEPVFITNLDRVDCRTETPYGTIASRWERQGKTLIWNVTVPWNTSATVKLPLFDASGIAVNGTPQKENEFELPAGNWEILVNKRVEKTKAEGHDLDQFAGIDPDDGMTSRSEAMVLPRLIPNPGSTEDYARVKRTCTGVPSLAVSPGGRIWAAWFSGKTPGEIIERCPYAYSVVSTSGDGGKTWKEVLAIDPDGAGPLKAYDPRPWIDPDGKLWVFFTLPYPLHKHCWAVTAENGEQENPQWSEPRPVFEGVLLNSPTVLASGEWLFPTYARRPQNMATILSHVSQDKGKTFTVKGEIVVSYDLRASEPMAVQRQDGPLWMLVRTVKGISESISIDGGVNWSELKTQAIKHTASRFFIGRLQSGNLLLVKHMGIDTDPASVGRVQRRELTAFISRDDGRTWSEGLMIDERIGCSYPDAQQVADGTIYLTWDFMRSQDQEVWMTTFREEDVLSANEDATARVKANRRLVSKGGTPE